MTAGKIASLSPYEHRVILVEKVVTDHTALDQAASHELAIQMLHAIDHMPEKVR